MLPEKRCMRMRWISRYHRWNISLVGDEKLEFDIFRPSALKKCQMHAINTNSLTWLCRYAIEELLLSENQYPSIPTFSCH